MIYTKYNIDGIKCVHQLGGEVYTLTVLYNNKVQVAWSEDQTVYSMELVLKYLNEGAWKLVEKAGPVKLSITKPTQPTDIKTPEHYDNSKGTLYQVAKERGWNPYLFDIVKRLERAERKGEFESDCDKSIAVIQLYKKEQGSKNKCNEYNKRVDERHFHKRKTH